MAMCPNRKAQRPAVLAHATTEQNWGLSPLSERKNTEPRNASGQKTAGEERKQYCASSARHKCSRAPLSHFAASWAVCWYFLQTELDLAGAVLAVVFQKPAYPEEALASVTPNVLKSWRDKFAKEPLNQIQAAAIEVLLVDYPHRRELLIPSKDDIKPPPREGLLAWHKKVIGRNNVIGMAVLHALMMLTPNAQPPCRPTLEVPARSNRELG